MNMNSITNYNNNFNLTSGAVGQYKNELSNEHLIILGDVMIRGRLKQIDGTVSEAKAHMPYFPSVDISQKDLKSFINKGQVISEGTIRVLSRRQNIESGNVSLSICFSGAKEKFLRNFDEGTLSNNPQEIESAIFDAGINIKPPRKANIDFIVNETIFLSQSLPVETFHEGFYIDETRRIKHSDAERFYRDAAPDSEIKELFLSAESGEEKFFAAFIALYRTLFELNAIYKIPVPPLAITARSPRAFSWLSDALNAHKITQLDGKICYNIINGINTVDLTHSTVYNINTHVRKLLNITENAIICVIDDPRKLDAIIEPEEVHTLPFIDPQTPPETVKRVCYALLAKILRGEIDPFEYDEKIQACINRDSIYLYICSLLLFRLLGLVGFAEEESLQLVRKFNNLFEEKIDCNEPFDLAPLKEAIRTSTNNVFAHGKSSFYVAAELIQNVAASHGMSVASYAKVLDSLHLFPCNDWRQINFTAGARSYRGYEILAESLYRFGELRYQSIDPRLAAPAFSLNIGECDGVPIGITHVGKLGSTNLHIFIEGASRSGKTHMINHIAQCAEKEKIPTISITCKGTEQAISQGHTLYLQGDINADLLEKYVFPGRMVSFIVDNNMVTSDRLLDEIYAHMCKFGVFPALLIIDEAQNFNLRQDAPLVSKILRQGAKLGIICLLSTQYLNSGNASHISNAIAQCGNRISFTPGNNIKSLHPFGITADNKEARRIVTEMEPHSFIVQGSQIATDRCFIDYPLIAKIPSQTQESNISTT